MSLNELRIAVVGHVDHGKSTLVGRLLLDTGAVPEQKREQLGDDPSAWLTDQLEAERRGRLTLDSGQAVLRTPARALVLIDTPGHRELVSNTLSGAAWAEAGLLVIDAERGVESQTRAHMQLLAILGVRRLVIVINKMDRVGYQEAVFTRLQQQAQPLIRRHGLTTHAIVPASALQGEHVVHRSAAMPWAPAPTALEALESLPAVALQPGPDEPCLSVQLIEQAVGRRWVLGRVEGGTLRVGQVLRSWPVGQAHRVVSLTRGKTPIEAAAPGTSVAARLDPAEGLARGSVLVSLDSELTPVQEPTLHLMCLSDPPQSPNPGDCLELRVGVSVAKAQVLAWCPMHPEVGEASERDPDTVLGYYTMRLKLTCPLMLDPAGHVPSLHRALVSARGRPVGIGVIAPSGSPAPGSPGTLGIPDSPGTPTPPSSAASGQGGSP